MQWEPAAGPVSPAHRPTVSTSRRPRARRPDVATQRADEGSLLHLVHRLVALRHATPALGPGGSLEVLTEDYPFAYVRGGTHLVVVNPRR